MSKEADANDHWTHEDAAGCGRSSPPVIVTRPKPRCDACGSSIDDLAHVVSEDCLSDCLTKSSAKPQALIKAVNEGILPNVDKHPSFREMMKTKHKAYQNRICDESVMTDELIAWIVRNVNNAVEVVTFLATPVKARIEQYLGTSSSSKWALYG